MEEMYDESLVAADHLRGDGHPAERVEAMVRALFGAWERHEHLYRAMFDARATSTTVRELWDTDRESFVPVVAGVIEAERAAGRAPAGADATPWPRCCSSSTTGCSSGSRSAARWAATSSSTRS